MPASRNFHFPVSTLVREAARLLGALRDTIVGPPVASRLAAGFDQAFAAQIAAVQKGDTDQSGTAGSVAALTQDQAKIYDEMVRLMARARHSASLAFPQNTALLHSEFQVGIHEPKDLASEVGRANKIVAACGIHADALALTGWHGGDTDSLAAAIKTLGGTDEEQEGAKDKKKGQTATRNAAANLLYRQCQLVQNAAELAFPESEAENAHAVVEARARYLLGVFPPRPGTSDDEPETPGTSNNPDSTPPAGGAA